MQIRRAMRVIENGRLMRRIQRKVTCHCECVYLIEGHGDYRVEASRDPDNPHFGHVAISRCPECGDENRRAIPRSTHY